MLTKQTTLRALSFIFLLIGAIFPARAENVELISKTTRPSVSAFGVSGASSVSADGRYVLFMSAAANLVTNDTESLMLDLFLRDLNDDRITLISVNTNGVGGGNGDSLTGQISTNGQWVLFESKASDLVDRDDNDTYDVFLRDLATGKTEMVNRAENSAAPAKGASTPLMSEDAKVVVFQSEDRSFGQLGTHELSNIWAKDLTTGAFKKVNADLNLALNATNIVCSNPSMTSDGRFVTFQVNYSRGTEQHSDVFVRDLQAETTTLISADKASLYRNRTGRTDIAQAFHPLVSANGEYVFWKIKGAQNALLALIMRSDIAGGLPDFIGTNDTVGLEFDLSVDNSGTKAVFPKGKDVLLWTEESGKTNVVNKTMDGSATSAGVAASAMISDDGNWIAFMSDASDLTTNEVNGEFEWYLKNNASGEIYLVSKNEDGAGVGGVDISSLSMSDDASVIVFESDSDETVENDFNRSNDIFLSGKDADVIGLISGVDPALPNLSGFGVSEALGMSIDGRYLLFSSYADYIEENDFNQVEDIFIKDTVTGKTTLVSVSIDGVTPGDKGSSRAAISDNGRYVAFSSMASNLSNEDTNTVEDVFLRDMQTGTTTLISVNSAGNGSGNGASSSPQISADGSMVLFETLATNLGYTDSNNGYDFYVRDVKAGVTLLVTKRFAEPPATSRNGNYDPVLSKDGQWVAFKSQASDLIEGGTSSPSRAINYLRKLPSGPTVSLLSTNGFPMQKLVFSPNNQWLAAPDYILSPRTTNYLIYDLNSLASEILCNNCDSLTFDPESKWVAYRQQIPEVTNRQWMLMNLETKQTNLITAVLGGATFANAESQALALSANAERAVFKSSASNLVAADTNNTADVYLWTRQDGTLSALTTNSVAAGAQPLTDKIYLSADGEIVFFQSVAGNIAAGDYNQELDTFMITLEPQSASLRVTPTLQTNGEIKLEWNSVAGQLYQVQFKDTLNDPWTTSGAEIAGNGAIRSHSESIAGKSTRFFRVQEITR